jgi:hypothetical protein
MARGWARGRINCLCSASRRLIFSACGCISRGIHIPEKGEASLLDFYRYPLFVSDI